MIEGKSDPYAGLKRHQLTPEMQATVEHRVFYYAAKNSQTATAFRSNTLVLG